MTHPSPSEECVLEVVGLIPVGALSTYGDVAELLRECDVRCTPRQVAGALSRYGAQVPWWRVVQSGGTIAEQVLHRARELLAAEGVPTQGRRVPLQQLRWEPDPDVVRGALGRSGLV